MLKPQGKTKDINVIRLIWICFLLITLTACANKTPSSMNAPTAPIIKNPKERETVLNRIQSWQVNGKIAVQTAQNSGSATVDWIQNPNSYVISMLGPLGSNGLKLTGRPGFVTLQTADGKHYSASSAEELLAKGWGFRLPLSNLRYWIRGLPVPNLPARSQKDSFGRLTSLTQTNWQVEYLAYTTRGTVDLPTNLVITSPALKVKIFVHEWQVR